MTERKSIMMVYSDLKVSLYASVLKISEDWQYSVQIFPLAFSFPLTKIHFCKCEEHRVPTMLVPLLAVIIIPSVQESALTPEMDSTAETSTGDHIMSSTS